MDLLEAKAIVDSQLELHKSFLAVFDLINSEQ